MTRPRSTICGARCRYRRRTKTNRTPTTSARTTSAGSACPRKNLLYFIEKSAPRLEDWQRELIRIVRHVSQYFYPQRQTQVMNEGCATFVHYEDR